MRDFNGSSDFLEVAHDSLLDMGTSDFTIMFIWRGDIPAGNDRFISKGNTSGGTGGGVRYEIHKQNAGGGKLVFDIDDGTTKSSCEMGFSGEDFDDGSDHVWLFERDSGTHLKIFEDGNTEKATVADGTGDIDVGLSLLLMAGRGGDDSVIWYCDGKIGEIAIWKRLLSGDEKDALGQFFSPLFFPKDLVFYSIIMTPNIVDFMGNPITRTGTSGVGHPRLRYPVTQRIGAPRIVVGGQVPVGSLALMGVGV